MSRSKPSAPRGCPMGANCGGYWTRNTRTGAMTPVPCAGCGKPPKGSG